MRRLGVLAARQTSWISLRFNMTRRMAPILDIGQLLACTLCRSIPADVSEDYSFEGIRSVG